MQVFLTVDVESASGDYNRDVYGNGYGLDDLLSSLDRHGLKATFFVEAASTTVRPKADLEDACRRILSAGMDLQLHVHPEMAALPGIVNTDGVLWRNTREEQGRLIAAGRDILHKITGVTPLAFRAGSLTADRNTLAAMLDGGITLGSNRDLDTHSSIESRLNDVFPVVNDISDFGGVTDIPVSAFRSPLPRLDGHWRHLEPCALGLGEMTHALTAMHHAGYRTACLLTHPHEFYYRRGNRFHPNHINRRRWEGLLNFLKRSPWAQPMTFPDFHAVRSHPPSTIPHQPFPATPPPICAPRVVAAVPAAPRVPAAPPIRLPLHWTLWRLAEQALKRLHGEHIR